MTRPMPVKKGGRKAIIHVSMWGPKGRRLWTFHNEEKVYLKNVADARAWATKHGFDGVQLVSPKEEDGYV